MSFKGVIWVSVQCHVEDPSGFEAVILSEAEVGCFVAVDTRKSNAGH